MAIFVDRHGGAAEKTTAHPQIAHQYLEIYLHSQYYTKQRVTRSAPPETMF